MDRELNIANVGTFTDGYAVTKYISKRTVQLLKEIFRYCFPMFRLTDVYLNMLRQLLRSYYWYSLTALGI
jgi:hypothetical protein